MKRIVWLFFPIISLGCFAQQYSQYWKNIDYAGDGKEYHKLDIYLPKIEKAKSPVVIAIYGSAWFGNNLKESAFNTLGGSLLDAGFAVVTPNHRSSYDAKYPAQIHDIKAAIRFIRANGAQYQLDTSFIGITGFSSGGHLAALAGTTRNVKEYTVDSVTMDIEGNVGSFASYSSSVHAVVDWFGPTDLLKMDSCETSSMIDHSSATAPEAVLIGGPVQENKAKATLANPITYVDSSDPPFLILHGDKDPLVSYCQSEMLFKALQKAGVPSQFVLVPGAQHGPGLFEEKYFKMMADFFLQQLEVTNIIRTENDDFLNFSVSQNYPNPFNSSTAITFTLPIKSFVALAVFDSLGREVSKLLSKEMEPGTHTIQWNAEKYPTGTYYIRFQLGEKVKVKKLILLK